jgi:hypothetical protein
MRDWRAAIAWVAAAAALLALAMRHLRGRHRATGAPAPSSGFSLIVTFAAVSYFSWALGFGYYRYAVPLEMLTGVVTVGALTVIFEQRRLRIVAALGLGDRHKHHRLYGLVADRTWPEPPRIWRPLCRRRGAAIARQRHRIDRHLGPGGVLYPVCQSGRAISQHREQLPELSQNNKFAAEVKRLMREPGRPNSCSMSTPSTPKS